MTHELTLSVPMQEVRLRFDAERVNEAQIRERIRSAGFEPAWTPMI